MASTSTPRWPALPEGLGGLLRAARREAGLSRGRLADLLNVSPGRLQGIEEELRPPSAELAERLCAALSLDPWREAVVMACAVDQDALTTRRGTRHANPRGTPLTPEVRARIAAERARGRSLQAIADDLARDRVPTPCGGRWWPASVRAVVSAEE